jgi:uncharacterized membrane protein YphA (DoxX/SURF4 family)
MRYLTKQVEHIMAAGPAVNYPTTNYAKKSVVRHFPAVGRVLMGVLFFLSGLNGLLNLLPPPATQLPDKAQAFVAALMNTGYMFPLIMATQLLAGALLLANRFVPMALVLIAPFIVNSVAFHVFLEPSGLPMALVVLALELYLACTYRQAYRPMLAMRSTATGVK